MGLKENHHKGDENSSSRSTRLSCHLSPPFMWSLFRPKLTSYNLINSNKLYIPHMNTTKCGLRSFSAYGSTLWISLPGQSIKLCGDLKSCKTCMKTWQGIPGKCNMCKLLFSIVCVLLISIFYQYLFTYYILTNVLLFIICIVLLL